MKNPAKNKIRALLLSAATALLSTHAQAEETATIIPDLVNNDDFFGETKRSWGKVFTAPLFRKTHQGFRG